MTTVADATQAWANANKLAVTASQARTLAERPPLDTGHSQEAIDAAAAAAGAFYTAGRAYEAASTAQIDLSNPAGQAFAQRDYWNGVVQSMRNLLGQAQQEAKQRADAALLQAQAAETAKQQQAQRDAAARQTGSGATTARVGSSLATVLKRPTTQPAATTDWGKVGEAGPAIPGVNYPAIVQGNYGTSLTAPATPGLLSSLPSWALPVGGLALAVGAYLMFFRRPAGVAGLRGFGRCNGLGGLGCRPLSSFRGLSHPGNLNKRGCHKNKKTGRKHCHRPSGYRRGGGGWLKAYADRMGY